MPAAPDYQAVCQRFIAGLEAAARSHETGDFPAISAGYDQLDGELPRNAGPEFDKLHVALHFWDGWIDARNHDWRYYPGITAADWPRLARGIVNDLQRDLEISDEVVAERFDFRRHAARPSLWARLKGMFGVRGPV